MPLDLEKARLMYKLAVSKKNWGRKYDRLEHYKKFPNINKIIKELSKLRWLIIYNKPHYKAISLNTKHKKEIVEFIESKLPEVKGFIT